MDLQLDPASPVALYLQLSQQVRRMIAIGALRPGERLPTVRNLAAQARVNRNTAARAIQHLERGGLVRTRVGQGTFVAENGAGGQDPARTESMVNEAIDRLLVEAHGAGVPLEELGWRLTRRIDAFQRERAAGEAASRDEETPS